MIEYRRDLAPGTTDDQADAEEAHVRAHLSAVATAGDDPDALAGMVDVYRLLDETTGVLTIVGVLDARPAAPYLDDRYDPLAEVEPALFAEQVELAQADEAPRG